MSEKDSQQPVGDDVVRRGKPMRPDTRMKKAGAKVATEWFKRLSPKAKEFLSDHDVRVLTQDITWALHRLSRGEAPEGRTHAEEESEIEIEESQEAEG